MTEALMVNGPMDGKIFAFPKDTPYFYCQTLEVTNLSGGVRTLMHTYKQTGLSIYQYAPEQIAPGREDEVGNVEPFGVHPMSNECYPCDQCHGIAWSGVVVTLPRGPRMVECLTCLAQRETARRKIRSL